MSCPRDLAPSSEQRRGRSSALRARLGALTLGLALTLGAPGCSAYDGRYISFPLNSMQMVENAAANDWGFRKALAVELGFQIFPWTWVATLLDLLLFPVTGIHDAYEAAAERRASVPFREQVRKRKRGPSPRENTLPPSEAASLVGKDKEREGLEPLAPTER